MRLFLKVAYLASITFCFIFRPATKAVIVAIWLHNKVLLVKNSYNHKLVIPGGYMKLGENALEAAVREVKEETGISAEPNQFINIFSISGLFNYKRETIQCFELILNSPPDIQLDQREVIWAEFFTIENALAQNLSSPVRKFLLNYLGNS